MAAPAEPGRPGAPYRVLHIIASFRCGVTDDLLHEPELGAHVRTEETTLVAHEKDRR